MMTRTCPQCHQQQTESDSHICEFCQAELMDNGLLADSLAVWDQKSAPALWGRILPLAITVVGGLLTAYTRYSVYLFAGIIAAAASYYVLNNRDKNVK